MNTTVELRGNAGTPLKPLLIPEDENRPCVPVSFTLVKGSGEFLYKDDATDTLGSAVAEFLPDKPGRFRIECRLGERGELGLIIFKGTVKGRREDDATRHAGQRRSPRKKPNVSPVPVTPRATETMAPDAVEPDIPITIEEPRPAHAPDPTFLGDGAPCPPLTPPVWPTGPAPETAPPDPVVYKAVPAPPPREPDPVPSPRRQRDIPPAPPKKHPLGHGVTHLILLLAALLALLLLSGLLAMVVSHHVRHESESSATSTTSGGLVVDCVHPTSVSFLDGHRMVLKGCAPAAR